MLENTVAVTLTSQLPIAARSALDPLSPLIDDPEVTDLFINPDGTVWQHRNGRHAPAAHRSMSQAEARQLAVALISAGGRHLDELTPCVDVKIGGGIRVHAVLAPVSVGGASISIRVPRASAKSFEELVAAGLCDDVMAERLRGAMRARENLLITGATGSGKTTLLAALMSEVPSTERVVTIEDVAELTITHPHVVALEARQSNVEGKGQIDLSQLLREALRMRPDRLVLGECRGPELLLLLSALNTGHDGGAGTVHASTLTDVPARLEALAATASVSPSDLARQVVSAIDLVVHLRSSPRGRSIHQLGALRIGDRGTLEAVALA